MLEHGELTARVIESRKKARSKYEAYYDFREAVKVVPSHRYLAVRRGEKEGFLRLDIEVDATPVLEALAARLVTRETGKPLWESRQEVMATLRAVDLTVEEGLEVLAPRVVDEISARSDRLPRGVVAVLAPAVLGRRPRRSTLGCPLPGRTRVRGARRLLCRLPRWLCGADRVALAARERWHPRRAA